MGEEKEITITYETLFELLRREKTREELQKLNLSFFTDVVAYLREKQELFKAQQDELFFGDEKNKTAMQLQNIRKILTELYDRREKKIFNLAMIRARTKGLVDMGSLLDEEKKLCDALVHLLEGYRGSILHQLLLGLSPQQSSAAFSSSASAQPQTSATLPPAAPFLHSPSSSSAVSSPPSPVVLSPAASPTTKEEQVITIRFTHTMPKFVGPRLEIYGPYGAKDTATLPNQIARVLIEKGRAEPLDAGSPPPSQEEKQIEAMEPL